MFTVVTPCFPRRAGISRKAIQSVAAQKDCDWPVQVILVDDAAPEPRIACNTGQAPAEDRTRWSDFVDSNNGWPSSVAALAAGGVSCSEALALAARDCVVNLFAGSSAATAAYVPRARQGIRSRPHVPHHARQRNGQRLQLLAPHLRCNPALVAATPAFGLRLALQRSRSQRAA